MSTCSLGCGIRLGVGEEMNYKELIEKREKAKQAKQDSRFSAEVDLRGEGYINLSIDPDESDFRLAMEYPNALVTAEELKELRDILNELFPVEEGK